jgi:hypothetical protein
MTNTIHPLHLLAIAVTLSLGAATTASAQVQLSLGISTPSVSIGINMPVYPQFVRVPNYPVYYVPNQQSNYFFYDGMYWVFWQDAWYMSSWYNGPWYSVEPQVVPLFVLRIPVRYYRSPPTFFFGWVADSPPHWGEHWGNDWSRQRSGWDRWDRRSSPAPAPLPTYQRQYSGDRYPRVVQEQQSLHNRNYRYQSRDAVVRQQVQRQAAPVARPDHGVPVAPPVRTERPAQQQAPTQQVRPPETPRQQPQQHGNDRREPQQAPVQQVRPPETPRQQPQQQGNDRREQQAPNAPGPAQSQGRNPGQGQGKEQQDRHSDAERGNDKSQDRDDKDEPGSQRKR